jgi:hypothetical protein
MKKSEEEQEESKILHKLSWKGNSFGHTCRMDDGHMVKTVVFGMMEGTNRKGRPRREWLNDITEWCKKGIQEVAGIAKDWEAWKQLVEDVFGHHGFRNYSNMLAAHANCSSA